MKRCKILGLAILLAGVMLTACENGGNETNTAEESVSSTVAAEDTTIKTEIENTETESSAEVSEVTEVAAYTRIEDVTLPDLHVDIYSDPTEIRRQCAENIIFDEKRVGKYTVELAGNQVMRDTETDPDAIFSYYLDLRLLLDGEVIDSVRAFANSVNMGQGAYKLAADGLGDYVSIYEMRIEKGVYHLIVFRYFDGEGGCEATFYTIKNRAFEFFQDAVSVPMSDTIFASGEKSYYGDKGYIADNLNRVRYVFDFEEMTVTVEDGKIYSNEYLLEIMAAVEAVWGDYDINNAGVYWSDVRIGVFNEEDVPRLREYLLGLGFEADSFEVVVDTNLAVPC